MLEYQIHGSPDRPALCFLHGFMGSARDWTPLVNALETEAYCLAVDLPGHGCSTGRPAYEYSMEGVTQALADVLDDAGLDRCALVGYSMGGRVALYFSIFHPGRVSRLVLESTSPGLEEPEDRARRRALDAERADRIRADLSSFLTDWYRQPLFASLDRHDLVEDMVQRRGRNDPAELARMLEGLSPGRQPSLWPHLSDVQVPSLILTGGLDDKYTGITERTARHLGRAHRVVVPNAGHNVHAERPQAYLAHLCRFLDRT
jgi:2-succinyl-6-hydroxy-2,4-cyclohexadiene-1-carboxylate synthase